MKPLSAAILTLVALPASVAGGPFDAEEAEPTAESLAVPALVSETRAIPASGEFSIAIHFDIEPGWHLYWKNPGDTGAPMAIDLDLPEGLVAGDVRWPAPRRYLHAGLLDYIHEDELTLVIPIHVESPPASPAEMSVDLEWLVCKDMCLAGFGTLDLTMPVADSRSAVEASDASPLFDRARAQWPEAIDATALDAPVRAEWRGETLTLRASGAEAIEWFPASPSAAQPPSIDEQGAASGGTLRIAYPPAVRDADRVTGVARVVRGGAEHTYEIVLPPPRGG